MSDVMIECQKAMSGFMKMSLMHDTRNNEFRSFSKSYRPEYFQEEGLDLFVTIHEKRPEFFKFVLENNPKYEGLTSESIRLPVLSIIVENNLQCLRVLFDKKIPKETLSKILEDYGDRLPENLDNNTLQTVKKYIE